MDGLAKWFPRPKSNTRRPSSTVHPDKPKKDCAACETLHQPWIQMCCVWSWNNWYFKAYTSNSEIDVIKLLQAYGMVPTEGFELKHRRKKVATDEIIIIQTLGDDLHLNPNHWYCMEVWLNVILVYSRKLVITFCQYLHTSPTILFQIKLVNL